MDSAFWKPGMEFTGYFSKQRFPAVWYNDSIFRLRICKELISYFTGSDKRLEILFISSSIPG